MNPENTGFKQPVQNLRDELAVERTILANERSFLAYTRTALTCAVGSVSVFHFFQGKLMFQTLAFLLGTAGITLFAYGVKRYYNVQKIIQKINES